MYVQCVLTISIPQNVCINHFHTACDTFVWQTLIQVLAISAIESYKYIYIKIMKRSNKEKLDIINIHLFRKYDWCYSPATYKCTHIDSV